MLDMVQTFKDFVHAKFAASRDLASRYYEKNNGSSNGTGGKGDETRRNRRDPAGSIRREYRRIRDILKSLQIWDVGL